MPNNDIQVICKSVFLRNRGLLHKNVCLGALPIILLCRRPFPVQAQLVRRHSAPTITFHTIMSLIHNTTLRMKDQRRIKNIAMEFETKIRLNFITRKSGRLTLNHAETVSRIPVMKESCLCCFMPL